ncbi:uncharacterized protein PpBr36_10678 [Pyricularia pennisetigena]|uniref:uncharacterized protein n=1 Tax=Pyricularia pennisetigena TaxID=1578925 RepID=UPI00114FE246|nr:uncharacterized protein PpBr36_10678 [Pyricularia pennisetigena]TLS20946.1 hypothetical protein PpBr36_10678 [Pyricularia pennisetigena]
MCGASVIVSLCRHDAETNGHAAATRADKESRLSKSLDFMAHRGPDARGIWIDPTARVGLAHARLTIIDLSAEGNQPLHDDQGHIHAVINGEIYDHDRLRQECVDAGYRFKGHSDSEVVVALYQRYGAPAFLEHCRGEFSMVIYDDRSGEVFACRDRCGIKPLFYTVVQDELWFASEIKGFLGMGWKPEWAVEKIAMGITQIGPNTIFKGVNRIEPGFYMRVTRDGTMTHSKYWDFDFPDKTKVDNRSMEEMVEELRAELVNAVRLRLRADVPVGIYLSGGLDSSLVAGIAKKLIDEEGVTAGSQKASERMTTFTIAVNSDKGDSVYNEAAIASRTAKFLGVKEKTLNADEELLASTFEDACWFCEQTMANLSICAKVALSRLARESGITVILTGEGADETFAGYPWVLPDLVTEPDYSRPDAAMNRDIDKLRGPVREQMFNLWAALNSPELPQLLKEVKPETWDRMNHASTPFLFDNAGGVHLLHPKLLARYNIDRRINNVLDCLDQSTLDSIREKWHPLNSSVYFNHKIILSNLVIPLNGDRTEMANSIEGRPPILDHKVLELSTRLPPSVKNGYFPGGSDLNSGETIFRTNDGQELITKFREKLILREAARPFVTDEIYTRPKHSFMASNMYGPGGPIHQLLKRLLTKENVDAVGFLDWPKIQGHLEHVFDPESRGKNFTPCLAAASFVVISQRFGVATASLE